MTDSAVPIAERELSGRLSPRPIRCLVPIVFSIIGLVLICGAYWLVLGPVIPPGKLDGLREATRADVRRILGDPTEVHPSGNWIYMRLFNPGWVEIYFDHDGRVSVINDEQACPDLWGRGSWQK